MQKTLVSLLSGSHTQGIEQEIPSRSDLSRSDGSSLVPAIPWMVEKDMNERAQHSRVMKTQQLVSRCLEGEEIMASVMADLHYQPDGI